MTIVLPHVFQDGVNETASGVAVNENFNTLKAALEAAEATLATLTAAPGAYVARAPLSPETLSGTGSSEWTNPSGTKTAVVDYDLELHPGGGGFACIVKVYVGGVLIGEYQTAENLPNFRVIGAAVVAPSQKLKFELTSGGASKASGINVAYRLKPTAGL